MCTYRMRVRGCVFNRIGLFSCLCICIFQEARRNYAAELRGTFGRGGHRGCAPSSSASDGGSGDGGGSGGQARGGRRGGNSNPQQQPWYQSSEGVSYKEAAAFFAAAFAAEVSVHTQGVHRGVTESCACAKGVFF